MTTLKIQSNPIQLNII